MSLTRGQLPVRLTPLVGREAELDEIVRVLERNRLICERHTAGAGPHGEQVKYRGTGCAVARARPDGTWRIVAGAWHLGTAPGQTAARGTGAGTALVRDT